MDRDDLELLAKGMERIARRQDLQDCVTLLPANELPAGLMVTTTGIVIGGQEYVAVSMLDVRDWLGTGVEVAA